MARIRLPVLGLALLLIVSACNGTPPGGLTVTTDPTALELAPGQQAQVAVNVERAAGTLGAAAITLQDAPEGVTAQPLTIAAEATSGTLFIEAGSEVEPGPYSLTVRAEVGTTTASTTLQLTVVLTAEEQELRAAIRAALPDLEDFVLIRIDPVQEEEIISTLMDLANVGDVEDPVALGPLPIIGADGRVTQLDWIAYPHNIYAHPERPAFTPEVLVIAFDEVDGQVVEEVIDELATPSLTFQGLPHFADFEAFLRFVGDAEGEEVFQDQTRFQPSVINVIFDHQTNTSLGFEAAYYGAENPSVLESLASLLDLHVGGEEAERLVGLTDHNYLLYTHDDFQPPVLHGETEETELNPPVEPPVILNPLNHFLENGWRTFSAVMVADDTIYNPDTGSWLVSGWFSRTAAAANRANFYWVWAQWGPQIPASATTLPSGVRNNGLVVRTQLRQYRVLTQSGKQKVTNALPFPGLCGVSGSYLSFLRGLSGTNQRFVNDGWMWWTKRYNGGCAYLNTIDKAPKDGAVGVSSFNSSSTDWTSFLYMHEFGHLIGGTHVTNAPGSPETFDSHRCRLLGFFPFGPTGPSLESYASGTRTYCFATTSTSGTPKKNATKVAEFLHSRIQP
jgi:hypothetical protein